jgi:hypothetical protein
VQRGLLALVLHTAAFIWRLSSQEMLHLMQGSVYGSAGTESVRMSALTLHALAAAEPQPEGQQAGRRLAH